MQLELIPQIKHTKSDNFFLLSGPCAIEGEDMALRIAEKIVRITDALEIPSLRQTIQAKNKAKIIKKQII